MQAEWLMAFDPTVVIMDFGTDAHIYDPGVFRAGCLKLEDYVEMVELAVDVADSKSALNRLALIGQGGYGIEGGPCGTFPQIFTAAVGDYSEGCRFLVWWALCS